MVAAARLSCTFVLVASAAGAGSRGGIAPVCESMLRDVANRGHSDVQLAAYCRASMPPQLCQDATAALGQQPWPADRIASACRTWEGQIGAQTMQGAPGREAMDYQELQQYLDECMKAKADAGICQNTKTGKPLSLNKCIDYKQETYPEQTKNIMDALQRFYDAATGTASAITDGAIGRSQRIEPVAVAGRPKLGAVAGLALFFASAVAATVGLLRLRSSRLMRRSLVATAGDEEQQTRE